MNTRPANIAVAMLLLYCTVAASLHAQQESGAGAGGDSDFPALRVGLHAGVQTNLLRYQVYPFAGEFQAVTSESTVYGLALQFPIDEEWSLLTEISRWKQSWITRQDGEPRIALRRIEHASYEFPLLVVYRPPVPIIPLYVAVGPQVMLATNAENAFELTYTSFSERGGWEENRQSFDQTALRLTAVGEIGLDLPLTRKLAMHISMRYLLPFARAVDEDILSIRDFSYWRLRTGLLLQL